MNKQKSHFKKVKKSLTDQISSNNFINPPAEYHRTAKMTLFKYQSKRSNSHLKTSRLNNLHPPWLLTALRIKSKCLTMVKGLRSDHCSFFLRLCPPRFTDQPPWPSFTTCSFSMMSSSHFLYQACLCVAGSFSSLRCQPLRVSPARCLLW